jgi:hypothetical protein
MLLLIVGYEESTVFGFAPPLQRSYYVSAKSTVRENLTTGSKVEMIIQAV